LSPADAIIKAAEHISHNQAEGSLRKSITYKLIASMAGVSEEDVRLCHESGPETARLAIKLAMSYPPTLVRKALRELLNADKPQTITDDAIIARLPGRDAALLDQARATDPLLADALVQLDGQNLGDIHLEVHRVAVRRNYLALLNRLAPPKLPRSKTQNTHGVDASA
jgi:hypothetical protein